MRSIIRRVFEVQDKRNLKDPRNPYFEFYMTFTNQLNKLSDRVIQIENVRFKEEHIGFDCNLVYEIIMDDKTDEYAEMVIRDKNSQNDLNLAKHENGKLKSELSYTKGRITEYLVEIEKRGRRERRIKLIYGCVIIILFLLLLVVEFI